MLAEDRQAVSDTHADDTQQPNEQIPFHILFPFSADAVLG